MKKVELILLFLGFAGILTGQVPQVKWSYDLNDMSFGNAALADLDRDGLPEIAFSTYRNDGRIIVLNAEDGSLLWEKSAGGCADVAPLIADVDMDGELEIVLPGSCNPVTYCFDGATGEIEWTTPTHGSDSPPTLADMDNDGKPEILHGGFNGWIICINGEDGSLAWEFNADPNSWIQTAPAILDVDADGQLDFVVGNWSFGEDHKLFAFRGNDHSLIWESGLPDGVMYHGVSYADIDYDGKPELVVGDYSGQLMVLDAEDGSLLWSFSFPDKYAVSAPTNIADMDGDGRLDIVFLDWYQLGALDHLGKLMWQYDIPEYTGSFRGCAVSDIDGDGGLDLVFATDNGKLFGVDGKEGTLLLEMDFRSETGLADLSFDHGPVIADFDGDGMMDVFVVGGHAEYPDLQNNYGRAFAVSLESPGGPDWPMFRRDIVRSACVCDGLTGTYAGVGVEESGIEMIYLPEEQMIQLIGLKERAECMIFDMDGRMMEFKTMTGESKIDVSSWPYGFYFYLIRSEGNIRKQGKFVRY